MILRKLNRCYIKIILGLGIFSFLIFSAFQNNLKEQTLQKAQIVSTCAIQELLKELEAEDASIFLYSSTYERRYLLTSYTRILNPNVEITTDSYYPDLLIKHRRGACELRRVASLPIDSSLYLALKEENKNLPNFYYLSCPILVNNTETLIGYISVVTTQENIIKGLDLAQYYSQEFSLEFENLLK